MLFRSHHLPRGEQNRPRNRSQDRHHREDQGEGHLAQPTGPACRSRCDRRKARQHHQPALDARPRGRPRRQQHDGAREQPGEPAGRRFTLVGLAADYCYRTKPWLMVSGVALGFAVSFGLVWLQIAQIRRQESKK